MKASEVLTEFRKGVGRDPRTRVDDFDAYLVAEAEKEAAEFEAPEPAPKRAKRGD